MPNTAYGSTAAVATEVPSSKRDCVPSCSVVASSIIMCSDVDVVASSDNILPPTTETNPLAELVVPSLVALVNLSESPTT